MQVFLADAEWNSILAALRHYEELLEFVKGAGLVDDAKGEWQEAEGLLQGSRLRSAAPVKAAGAVRNEEPTWRSSGRRRRPRNVFGT